MWKGPRETWELYNGFSERNIIQSNLVILEQKWYGALLILNLLPGFLFDPRPRPEGSYNIGSVVLPSSVRPSFCP